MDTTSEDRISELPDAVLITIISQLTLREATATSILSPRWQSLYTHYTRLDFPPFEPKPCPRTGGYNDKISKQVFSNYISMIDRFLVSHKADRIQEFRVRMPCMKGAHLQRWLNFSLSRRVEILEIIMSYPRGVRPGHRYSFRLSSKVLVGLRFLKDLSLSAADIDDEAVETLLSNSPLLESLSIQWCSTLTKVSVVGSPPNLKHFGISFCSPLQSIEIRDMMELVSLRCYMNVSPTTRVLRLSNVPKLIELDTSDDSWNTPALILPAIPSGILDQLQLLKLWTSRDRFCAPGYVIPELVNVKHVEVQVVLWMGTDANAFALLPVLEACRSLEELHVEFSAHRECDYEDVIPPHLRKRFLPKLRKLKLSRYSATQTEFRFAQIILGCADALEELVVQPISTSNEMRQQAEHHFQNTNRKHVRVVII